MNMRLGRIGSKEGASSAAIAMTVSGIFTFETKLLYKNGNSTYITLPLSVLLSLIIFLLIIRLMNRSCSISLGELLKKGLGGVFSPIVSALLTLLIFYAAYAPLSQFIRAMHGLFFDGVSYSRITVFTVPAALVCALLGFETIGRTARLVAPALFLVLLVSISASVSEFETYRLHPFPGNTAFQIAVQTLEEIGTFLPALLCLLINADGLNGTKTAKRAGVSAAFVSALVCLIAQLALALCYTYKELGELFMPMFRINYLNKFEAHFMRMDKLAHMIWLGGGMIAGAFYIHAGARLFSQSFDMRDIRPAIVGGIALVSLMIMIEVESKMSEAFASVKEFLNGYGFVLLCIPSIISGILAMTRAWRKECLEQR
ncbi:MAG: GerAB/ArcD/ProY family transporter [Clostridia bacterium]|nr:GerAB/ArcD/ProY family transporter [Clostridia bacterium]